MKWLKRFFYRGKRRQVRKQLLDHAAQTSLLSKRIENYGMRLSGVVRAKN